MVLYDNQNLTPLRRNKRNILTHSFICKPIRGPQKWNGGASFVWRSFGPTVKLFHSLATGMYRFVIHIAAAIYVLVIASCLLFHSHQLEFNEKFKLKPPPKLNLIIPRMHLDGRQRAVPKSNLVPFVFNAVGVQTAEKKNNSSQFLLFLYSQGTIICSGKDRKCTSLNITSCLVGGEQFPIVYKASGVYTCAITREMVLGEKLTILVSSSEGDEAGENENGSTVAKYISSMERQEDGMHIVPSDVIWEGQMDSAVQKGDGRYKVCIMTQEKVFPEYIEEWESYHRKIGVDHIYIYDNQSPVNLSERYKDSNDVEVVYWPWDRSQIQAQNHFLLTGKRRCQWGILIDVDEFVMIRTGGQDRSNTLKDLLNELRETRGISQLRLSSVTLGSSGHVYRPRQVAAEAYWHLANVQDNLTKPVVWLGHVLPNSEVHSLRLAAGHRSLITRSLLASGKQERIGLVHMKYRSWEDFVAKARGGRNSFRVASWERFAGGWSVHRPAMKHLVLRNGPPFLEFRQVWRRVIRQDRAPVHLSRWDEEDRKYLQIHRRESVRKRMHGTGLIAAVIEEERALLD